MRRARVDLHMEADPISAAAHEARILAHRARVERDEPPEQRPRIAPTVIAHGGLEFIAYHAHMGWFWRVADWSERYRTPVERRRRGPFGSREEALVDCDRTLNNRPQGD